jgi:uncharacterized protein
VYYSTWREKGPGVARQVLEDLEQLPLEIVDADLELTRAAELRAQHKLPYTDCFAAALAAARKASLATGDKDFSSVERKIDILWTLSDGVGKEYSNGSDQ